MARAHYGGLGRFQREFLEMNFPPAPETQTFLGLRAVIQSDSMRRLMAMVERVATTNTTVLITGESGSGKELVARALHHHSLRCSKPWVDLSCAALPEHLMESELFGYDKGAFSGADSAKPGLYEMAHQGTLFLDEVGELEPKMQVKLLRVLDGAPYYRLGGTRKVTADVRVVAATNQDLDQAVRAGRFRSDLYHRLCQIQLHVPPLRERRDDIIPMAECFLRDQRPTAWFEPAALEALRGYSWPGNVRELRNIVIKAAVMAVDDEIRAADLPIEPAKPGNVAGLPSSNLDGIERRTILNVLAQTGGHHQRAADLLGISRRTLSRKLKSYAAEAAGEQIFVT
jgi:DNA-binding NtrC family response regulator